MNLKGAKDLPQSTEELGKKALRLLRDLKVFEDEIAFVTPGHQSVGQEEEAHVYNHEKYPEVLKALDGLLNGNPRDETFEIANSIFRELAAVTV